MMDATLHGHCTDEELVGYSAPELAGSEQRAVRDHLVSCWQCRLRSKKLEEQALRIAGAIEADDFPDPQRVAAALEAFALVRSQP